jgi:bacillolysin
MVTHRRRSQILSLLVILTMMLSMFRLPSVSAQGKDGLKRQINPQTGKVSFIGPESGRSLSASRALGTFIRPQNPSIALAKRFGPEFGLKNPERDLSELKTNRSDNGQISVRYQQNYQGVPIMGGELIVNTNENGDLYSINGEISAELSVQTQPTIDAEQARQTALRAAAKWYQRTVEDFIASEPELWIYDESLLRSSTRPAELVWRIEVTPKDLGIPVRELVLVNAERGSISLHFNQIDHAWGETHNLNTTEEHPKSNSEHLTTDSAAVINAPLVQTYTANSSSALPGTFLCNQTDPNCSVGDSHAKAAHKYAIGTYNLYATQHGRDSIDNNGMTIISSVHYCSPSNCPYNNASWNGEQVVYGSASGWPLADDVVAHELTHGVTQHASNLFYYYQSGAINESFSDLWGEFYDQTNEQGTDTAGVKWQIGENVSGLGAIRSMSNPTSFGDPDKMSSPSYFQGGEDSGGVHTNSGINNKAIFLMVDGGTFNSKTVTALGWEKTAAIYYEVNTNLLSSGADYSDLYYALQQACSNLIGQKGITSGNCAEVKDAIDAVEMNGQPAPNFNTDAPYCGQGDPTTIFSDNLESGTGNWTFTNGAYPRWQLDSPYGPYAHSGNHSLYADDYPDTVTDASARLVSVSIPSGAYLHFAHAYDFEAADDYYDGGVLEYSINGGSTWVDAGSLIDYNGYQGTLFTGADNPLSGRSAFVGASHGYISTRVNLASLAGQTVTFRWRMGLDVAVYSWGWWVDDIQIYQCSTAGKVTLATPSATINTNQPTYTWSADNAATWYYLWVNGPSGNVIKQWYTSAQANCNGSTCSVTPDTALSAGSHTWWIQTWNSAGYGPWSDGMNFSITPPALPGKVTLMSPNNSISTTIPTYTWNEVNGATWYYLWVNGPSGNVIKTWYTSADANCNGTTCSVTPSTNLSAGSHTWWIQTWNSAGYGPWSNGMTFTVSPPGAATLVSPTGTTGDNTPTYTWNEVSGATWYYLWVDGPSGNVIKTWYSSAQANCNGSTCSVTPSTILSNGAHTWWIQTWNSVGYGPWSNRMDFSVP